MAQHTVSDGSKFSPYNAIFSPYNAIFSPYNAIFSPFWVHLVPLWFKSKQAKIWTKLEVNNIIMLCTVCSICWYGLCMYSTCSLVFFYTTAWACQF